MQKAKGKIGFKGFVVIASGVIVVTLSSLYNRTTLLHNAKLDTSRRTTDSLTWPKTFGYGRVATTQDIAAWDIDIQPDGKGLPAGSGTVHEGKVVYLAKCAACHGAEGKEIAGQKLPAPALVSDTTFQGRKSNTIGNYWPYATTVFDYIRRSMPYTAPGTLTNNEVYALTAYILGQNHIIKTDAVINAQTLPKVIMPAKKHFITDDREGGAEVK
ncbi:cytochrome c [Mucilaginibacter sp. Bleaf8]|uniref:c-type cytochrome n=1 Tax=Mucilaginibacter sp. Bleaf8 TaxID=2834430 RepID=UPI001BD09E52|nr:cytochrome c [Mucilaginibacter sp. Bleaf8]MBS7563798.1 cytochrome c [Mucilaginibacter sp. Bleaf8]